MSDKSIRQEYHRWLRLERGYSPNTIEGYEMDLDKLMSYTEEHGLDAVKMSFDELQEFIFEQFKTVRSEATQARVLAGIHSWFRFLLYKDYIDQDPSELLEGPKKSKHIPTVLTLDEVNRMMAAIDLSSNEGHRNRAMMEMLYGSGLRVSELVNLPLSRIYMDEHYMLCRSLRWRKSGSGTGCRTVLLGQSNPRHGILRSSTATVVRSHGRWSLPSCVTYAPKRVSPRPSRPTRCAIRLRPICCRTAPTCASSNNCSGTKTSRPRRFTPI